MDTSAAAVLELLATFYQNFHVMMVPSAGRWTLHDPQPAQEFVILDRIQSTLFYFINLYSTRERNSRFKISLSRQAAV